MSECPRPFYAVLLMPMSSPSVQRSNSPTVYAILRQRQLIPILRLLLHLVAWSVLPIAVFVRRSLWMHPPYLCARMQSALPTLLVHWLCDVLLLRRHQSHLLLGQERGSMPRLRSLVHRVDFLGTECSQGSLVVRPANPLLVPQTL